MILLKLNFLIFLGFLASLALNRIKNYRLLVRLNYLLLALVFLLPVIFSLIPAPVFDRPPILVTSPTTIERSMVTVTLPQRAVQTPEFSHSSKIPYLFFVITIFSLFAFIAVLVIDMRKIRRLLKSGFKVKKIGPINIIASEKGPFSFRIFRKKFVVLPTWILASQRDCKIAILHELEHHRAGDTLWAYGLYFVKSLFIYNPFIHFWIRNIYDLQELSCDEAVIGHKHVSLQDYRHCLWKVMAQPSEKILVGTAGMASDFKTLRRRFMSLKERKNPKWYMLFAAGVVSLFVAVSYASYNSVQDQRISISEAQGMAKNIKGEIPVTVNKHVLEQLNYFLRTEKGQRHTRAAFSRLPNYKTQLEAQFAELNFPPELLAVPFVESGFTNVYSPGGNAAGFWQFITQTARRYGLRVDDKIDERFNIRLETVAGRYLLDNKVRFNDWLLSLMAFNMGENHVQKGIDEHGTKDAWKLIDLGVENDHAYLAKVIAAIIILNNPPLAN